MVQKKINERTTQTRVELYQPVGDGTLKTVPVTIGLSDGQYAEITRGAEEGDVFITRLTVPTAGN